MGCGGCRLPGAKAQEGEERMPRASKGELAARRGVVVEGDSAEPKSCSCANSQRYLEVDLET